MDQTVLEKLSNKIHRKSQQESYNVSEIGINKNANGVALKRKKGRPIVNSNNKFKSAVNRDALQGNNFDDESRQAELIESNLNNTNDEV